MEMRGDGDNDTFKNIYILRGTAKYSDDIDNRRSLLSDIGGNVYGSATVGKSEEFNLQGNIERIFDQTISLNNIFHAFTTE